MRYCSPLRYPGGKAKLAKFIKLIFEANSLFDGHYVEPYAGGAGIAFPLLFEEYASHIHINDLNKSIYAFWHAVLNDTDNLCRMIYDTTVNMDEWTRQKEIQNHPEKFSTLDLAFSTFFLNRANRSGIIRGGVIGGKNQNGKWKIDARYNKDDLIGRIKKIAGYKERINLYNLDASAFIADVLPNLPMLTLIYLDPPYYVKGAGLYENHYCHDDHASVAKVVTSKIKQRWIVSYDNAPAIRKFYKGYRQLDYSLNYSAAARYQGSEVMIFCNQLSIPPVTNPVKMQAA